MDPAALVSRIAGVDIDTAGTGALQGLLRNVNELDGWTSSIQLQVTRRLGVLEQEGKSAPPSDVLARGRKTSKRTAEKTQKRADALGKAPGVEKQLAKGNISEEHADALANAAGRLDNDELRDELFDMDNELAEHAASDTPAQFARWLRKLTDQLSDDAGVERSEQQRQQASVSLGMNDATGMGWIRGELHPDDWMRLKRRLDAEVAALKKLPENEGRRTDQVAADALVALIVGGRATSVPPAEVITLIDLKTLIEGPHMDTVCEYSNGVPLSVETVRRHACTANIIPVVLDGDGQPLEVGRESRLATPAQRRALRSMYRTCAVDGCECDFDSCEIHHLIEWAYDNGRTDLENLLPVCKYHHHRTHEGRWRLQLDPSTRQLDVYLPDGTLHSRALPDLIAERAA